MPDAPEFCPKCAAHVQPSWPFCSHCGSRLLAKPEEGAQSVICSNCGSAVDTTGAFCWKCGVPLDTGREPFIPVPGSPSETSPKEEMLSSYADSPARSGSAPHFRDGKGSIRSEAYPSLDEMRIRPASNGNTASVGLAVVVAIVVFLATLGFVFLTNGAGLVHPGSASTPTPPNRDYVTINSLTVIFTFNSSHQFLGEPFGACATVNCPFLLENNTLSGNRGWSSFSFYVQNSDPLNWSHESAKIVGVTSTPSGVAQNGPGLALVDADSVQFGVVVAVTYNITNPAYGLTVDIEGDWS